MFFPTIVSLIRRDCQPPTNIFQGLSFGRKPVSSLCIAKPREQSCCEIMFPDPLTSLTIWIPGLTAVRFVERAQLRPSVLKGMFAREKPLWREQTLLTSPGVSGLGNFRGLTQFRQNLRFSWSLKKKEALLAWWKKAILNAWRQWNIYSLYLKRVITDDKTKATGSNKQHVATD